MLIIVITNFLCLSVGTVIQWIFYVWSERWCCSWTTLNCTDTVYIWLIHSGLHLLHAPFGQKEKKNNTTFYGLLLTLYYDSGFRSALFQGKVGRNTKVKMWRISSFRFKTCLYASRWGVSLSACQTRERAHSFPRSHSLTVYGNYGNSDLSSSRRFAV